MVYDWQGTTKVLADEKMRELGFTDYSKKNWFYSRRVGENFLDVAFTLTIEKSSGSWYELVEDLRFGQPFYYASNAKYGDRIIKDVDEQVKLLNDAGLEFQVDHAEYGFNR